MPILPESWTLLFLPQAPILESIIRASAIYLFAFLLLRVILRRESGGLGVSDILVIILIAAATQSSIAGQAVSVLDGFILVATLVAWDWLLSYVAFRNRRLSLLVRPRPRPIIKDGQILRENAQRELLTRSEIQQQLRLHHVGSVEEVAEAYMEPNGEMSVLRRHTPLPDEARPKRPRRPMG